jgi:non-homologous end joining protein Ku
MHWSKNSAICSINWNKNFRRKKEIFKGIRNKTSEAKITNTTQKIFQQKGNFSKPYIFFSSIPHNHTHTHINLKLQTHTQTQKKTKKKREEKERKNKVSEREERFCCSSFFLRSDRLVSLFKF